MKKIIVTITGFAFIMAIAAVKTNATSIEGNHLIITDTLPITDTVGSGNWQHSLRSNSSTKTDSYLLLKTRQDSMHKAPPL